MPTKNGSTVTVFQLKMLPVLFHMAIPVFSSKKRPDRVLCFALMRNITALLAISNLRMTAHSMLASENVSVKYLQHHTTQFQYRLKLTFKFVCQFINYTKQAMRWLMFRINIINYFTVNDLRVVFEQSQCFPSKETKEGIMSRSDKECLHYRNLSHMPHLYDSKLHTTCSWQSRVCMCVCVCDIYGTTLPSFQHKLKLTIKFVCQFIKIYKTS